jgi:hypothetical protein
MELAARAPPAPLASGSPCLYASRTRSSDMAKIVCVLYDDPVDG